MTAEHDHRTALPWLAFAAGLLPLVVVHLCYVISVQAAIIPGCIPYWSGCTSISATGRHGVAYFLFKAGMIPAAVLLAAYWALARRWLLALGRSDTTALRAMTWLGVIAAVFLVLYTVYLGSKGDFYSLMRRYGVTVYFSFSALAQMLLLRELLRPAFADTVRLPPWIVRGKFLIVAFLLVAGLLSIPIGNFVPDKDRAMNVIEWWFALAMSSYYLLSAAAWRASGFVAGFAIGRRADGA
ncbi:MAG: hypothetical protein L6Q83_09690 [Gammaproteobacteria bacterium]|nr:hypothetical protein [Gammaproteobacteria bacterium]